MLSCWGCITGGSSTHRTRSSRSNRVALRAALPSPGEAGARAVYLRPWRIDVVRRPGISSVVSALELARTAARALTAAGAPAPASLALILSADAELAALNARHMGEDGPTDVLSFPLLPLSAFPDHSGRPRDPSVDGPVVEPPHELPPGQRTHLGDIIVSVERALAQADRGRGGQSGDVAWSGADELRLLVVHGVLHVCGWDHAHAQERHAMRALERRVLELE